MRRPAGTGQFNDPAAVFRGIWQMGLRHRDSPSSFLPNTVYETGSSPLAGMTLALLPNKKLELY